MERIIQEVSLSRTKYEVLKVLSSADGEFTGREVGRLAGVSHQAAHVILRQLEGLGIVRRRVFSPSHLFRLNDCCVEIVRKICR